KSDLNAFHTNYNVAAGVIPPPAPEDAGRQADYSGGFLNCVLYPNTCRTSLDRPKTSEFNTNN
ncbi:MAG: hypothetical protein GWM88_06990, partial [Pseudomonadales bacterium]|nr:hypothetical protein [Pseudomonadales bacterium]NIX07765.1 hypothetical protein [Pseudomonadales bacterium]